jgi:hypothetical protein
MALPVKKQGHKKHRMVTMFQTDRLTPAGIHRRTGAERVSPPPTAARRAQVKHRMVTSGLNWGRLAKWELTQEASHCSNIFGRKIFSSQCPVLVCQPHLYPHLVARLITFHLQATKVALTIQHLRDSKALDTTKVKHDGSCHNLHRSSATEIRVCCQVKRSSQTQIVLNKTGSNQAGKSLHI